MRYAKQPSRPAMTLQKPAAGQPNSEWHEACFAGVLIYAAEMQQRGLKIETVH
jgi:hypothetical protein